MLTPLSTADTVYPTQGKVLQKTKVLKDQLSQLVTFGNHQHKPCQDKVLKDMVWKGLVASAHEAESPCQPH